MGIKGTVKPVNVEQIAVPHDELPTKTNVTGSSPLSLEFPELFALPWVLCRCDLLSGLLVFPSSFQGLNYHRLMSHIMNLGIHRERSYELYVFIFLPGIPS